MRQALDWRWIDAQLAGGVVGRRVVYYESVGSTNDLARELAVAGEPEGVVVLADGQTAGRGRAGKSPWRTPPFTSVALSVLLRPALAPEALPLLSMACGVAAVASLTSVAGIPARLKWPNDVVVDDRKLGGILVESSLSTTRVIHAVAGIGLNVNLLPAELGPLPDAAVPATSVQEAADGPVSREALIVALLQELDRLYGTICGGGPSGAEAVLTRYRDALATLGRAVRVTGVSSGVAEAGGASGVTSGAAGGAAGGAAIEGVAERITPRGELVVRLASGQWRTFAHGEVSVRYGP